MEEDSADELADPEEQALDETRKGKDLDPHMTNAIDDDNEDDQNPKHVNRKNLGKKNYDGYDVSLDYEADERETKPTPNPKTGSSKPSTQKRRLPWGAMDNEDEGREEEDKTPVQRQEDNGDSNEASDEDPPTMKRKKEVLARGDGAGTKFGTHK